MRTYLPLLIVLTTLPPVFAEEKQDAAKTTVDLSGKSNEELRKLLKSDDVGTIVAAQLALEKRDAVKPDQLARDMVPLLFHKSEDVQSNAHRIVARHGWDGITAAHIAVLSRPKPKLRDIQRLVNQSEKTDVLTRLAGAQVKGIQLTEPMTMKSESGGNSGVATVLRSWVETPFQFFRYLNGDSSGRQTAKDGKTPEKSPAKPKKPLSLRLKSEDVHVVFVALNEAEQLGTSAVRWTAEIAALKTRRNTMVASRAERILQTIDPDWKSIQPVYEQLLSSEDMALRLSAVNSLGLLTAVKDEAVISVLLKTLKSVPVARVRLAAASALFRSGVAARVHVQDILTQLQRETNPEVRLSTVQALQFIVAGDSKTQPVLRRLELQYCRQFVRRTMCDILKDQKDLAARTRRMRVASFLGPAAVKN